MTWVNIPIEFFISSDFRGSEPTDRATWLAMLAYCHAEENGGTIKGAASWSDRKWQQVVAVTKQETQSECDLWSWDGGDLLVHHYPSDKEMEVQHLRHIGRKKTEAKQSAARENGRLGGRPKNPTKNPTQNQTENPRETHRTEQNGTEQNGTEHKSASEPKIDGIKLAQTLQDYCRASDKRYDSQAVDSMVRAIKSGVTTQDELCATILEICTYAKRNPRAEKRFLPSPYDLIELEKWRSPLTSFLSTNVADFATQTATQAEMPYAEF